AARGGGRVRAGCGHPGCARTGARARVRDGQAPGVDPLPQHGLPVGDRPVPDALLIGWRTASAQSRRIEASMTSRGTRDGEPVRYPDPAIQVLDERFEKYRLRQAAVERLFTGCRWSEGPAWFGDGRYLLWSDIPNNRILRWDEETGAVSVFRKPSNNAN